MTVRKIVTTLLRAYGYRVQRVSSLEVAGLRLTDDLPILIPGDGAVCLDVGANKGQSIQMFRRCLVDPVIYAFEPATESFQALESRYRSSNTFLYNVGVSDHCNGGSLIKYENACLSSFLELTDSTENRFSGTPEFGREYVETITIDSFIEKQELSSIALLKSDTQGHELHVLRGARDSLQRGIIRNVLIELIFSPLYESQDNALEIMSVLDATGFRLVDLYEHERSEHVTAWCTGLFTRK
jgi:FkbM family methyltransferase